MNKKIVDFGVAVVFLVVICMAPCWGKTTDPPTTTTAAPPTTTNASSTTPTTALPVASANCTQYTDNQTACCGDTACAYIKCQVGTEDLEGCHNLNNATDKTKAATDCKIPEAQIGEKDLCKPPPSTTTTTTTTVAPTTKTTKATTTVNPSTTPVAGADCTQYTDNETACCGDTACAYIKCQVGTDIHEGCHNLNNATDKTKAASDCKVTEAEIDKKDLCNNDTTTTPKSPTTAPTPTSTQQTTTTAKSPPAAPSGQHFDGASFVGGMILMGGLIAIAYFALKFYRVRKDRSYRTL